MTYQNFQTAWLLWKGRQDVCFVVENMFPGNMFHSFVVETTPSSVVIQRIQRKVDTYDAAPWKETHFFEKNGNKKSSK